MPHCAVGGKKPVADATVVTIDSKVNEQGWEKRTELDGACRHGQK